MTIYNLERNIMELKTAQLIQDEKKRKKIMALNLTMGVAGVYLWWTIYRMLPNLSAWLTYTLLPIETGSHLGASVEFFLYDTPKVMMLLALVVFGAGRWRLFIWEPAFSSPFVPAGLSAA
jgi:hypothetical protein